MSERYYITGVQLACLKLLGDQGSRVIIKKIIDMQFIGDAKQFKENSIARKRKGGKAIKLTKAGWSEEERLGPSG